MWCAGLENLQIKAGVAAALQNPCPASLQQAVQWGTAGWVPLGTGEEACHSQGDLGSQLLWANAPAIWGCCTHTAAGAEVCTAQHSLAEPEGCRSALSQAKGVGKDF